MKYGVLFPQHDIGNDPSAIKGFAQVVEQLGFDHLMTYEHVLGADPDRPGWTDRWRPYDYQSAFHEPFVLFGYLAAVTARLRLATGILVLPQRQTPLVAKQAAEVDLLSGGRLCLGVGIGWNEYEYAGMGVDFATRARRIEEQIHLLRRLWREPLVTYEGRFDRLDRLGINPLPARQIPIWMGGSADPVLRRMARLAQGWFMHDGPPDALRAQIETLFGYLQQEGKDPKAFEIDVRLNTRQVPEAQWPDWIAQRQRLGITQVTVVPDGVKNGDFTAAADMLARFQKVGASFKS